MATTAMSVVYMLTTPIPEDGGDDPTVEQVRKRNKWDIDDYVCRGLILKDFKHKKKKLTLVELGSRLRIEKSLRAQDSDKPKGNNVCWSTVIGRVFSSVPRPSLRIPNGTKDIGGSLVPKEVVQQPKPELRKRKRNRTPKDFGPEFQLYLIKGTRDEKEAINDKMDSIMGNNSWVLTNLPPGCKPLGYKWIFKRKLKVDGTIEKFKARLVIQGFKQKSGINYFDTYAPVARIGTIRLLIAMTSIHNLIIHQMDVKTAFLNGDLEEGSKFDESGKGVIICLYVDDMLIFGHRPISEYSYDIQVEKVIANNGQAVVHMSNFIVIGCLMIIAMTCTEISNTEDNSSTSKWVFLLGGGAISWASKKQTCITGSIKRNSEFVGVKQLAGTELNS
ncbi:zinc finger, CCHC-type containing protein [Tanacetum coccineum]